MPKFHKNIFFRPTVFIVFQHFRARAGDAKSIDFNAYNFLGCEKTRIAIENRGCDAPKKSGRPRRIHGCRPCVGPPLPLDPRFSSRLSLSGDLCPSDFLEFGEKLTTLSCMAPHLRRTVFIAFQHYHVLQKHELPKRINGQPLSLGTCDLSFSTSFRILQRNDILSDQRFSLRFIILGRAPETPNQPISMIIIV